MSTETEHTPQPLVDREIVLFTEMDRDDVARLIRDLAGRLVGDGPVTLNIRVNRGADWSDGGKAITEVRFDTGGMIGSKAIVTDSFISEVIA